MPILSVDPGAPATAPPNAFFYSPPLDLPVRLAAPATSATSSRPRTMQRAILRPVDLSVTHGFNLVRAHLERMVATYRPDFEVAGINFDHEYGGPGHGWCTRLWMGESDLLWSEWEQMTEEAVNGILSGAWPRCSAEFWLSHPVLKDFYFTGLALLGAKSPAVPGLPAPQFLERPIFRIVPLQAGSTSIVESVSRSAALQDDRTVEQRRFDLSCGVSDSRYLELRSRYSIQPRQQSPGNPS